MSDSPLHDRLRQVAEGHTYRALGEMTGVHAENVRRYMTGQTPSIEFLGGLCASLEINADWLLTGRGPMRVSELPRQALHRADAGEIVRAVAEAMEKLHERVDRLEVYVQTLEARLRAGKESTKHDAGQTPRSLSGRARRVADAVPERSDEDAD